MQRGNSIRLGGFTIIELLMVIAIIGLLTSAAATNYVTAQRNARDNARKTTVSSLATGIETYYAVKKQFPGNIDTSTNPVPNSDESSYNVTYKNCATLDLGQTTYGRANTPYYYYYYPLPASDSCDKRPDIAGTYDHTQFQPFPTWIPGLSQYLNPLPIEKKFQAADGSESGGDMGEVLNASDSSASNKTRTYVYRHLPGGYAVYTRLEATAQDKDTLLKDSDITDLPHMPNGLTHVAGDNVFMVRR